MTTNRLHFTAARMLSLDESYSPVKLGSLASTLLQYPDKGDTMQLSYIVTPRDADEANRILEALAAFPTDASEPPKRSRSKKAKGKEDAPQDPPATGDSPQTSSAPPQPQNVPQNSAAPPQVQTPPAAPPQPPPPPAAKVATTVPASKEDFIDMLGKFIQGHQHGPEWASQFVQYHLQGFKANVASDLDPSMYPAFIQAINTPPA